MPRRPTPEIICARLQKAIDEVAMPDVPLDDRYVRTYPEMLSDFAQATKNGWTAERVAECVKLVYTWIPARGELRINMDVAEQIATELNIGTNTGRLIKLASELAKNSMVSGSKFLHFYDPARFPITDSWLQELSGKPDILSHQGRLALRCDCMGVSESNSIVAVAQASARNPQLIRVPVLSPGLQFGQHSRTRI
ncbi:hypothetical protein M3A49_01145 [Paraburkholderia sp. CNPSo 3076]|uniref:hypothetical protein n=1 Tax=Paraburkholderia sp. CNPSo 3076 TaxID=2940936 RepID=UPI0022501ABC|nr:hypothetical protein [Paraburkholderia sp. CNPSo 3076]MCX5538114.1 hypothetical protein [Paraburkholderia sp. CNPSo 3076]